MPSVSSGFLDQVNQDHAKRVALSFTRVRYRRRRRQVAALLDDRVAASTGLSVRLDDLDRGRLSWGAHCFVGRDRRAEEHVLEPVALDAGEMMNEPEQVCPRRPFAKKVPQPLAAVVTLDDDLIVRHAWDTGS